MTAAQVARQKADRPELFCPEPDCLWRTGGGYCPRHAERVMTPDGPGSVVGHWKERFWPMGAKPIRITWVIVDLDVGGRRTFRQELLRQPDSR